ncbi:MAG: ATP-binding cassette domain-containing protein [Candidatus Krumholzibacteria bacterium]|nr:ATP-binding cassette domain-containing protein [Candidatus Krumholzibacteria bacterium]
MSGGNALIRVNGLSRNYGLNKAVDNLTFDVAKGEVLGFLGPNGAGKTTTMKMLTCFLPPDSGSASIFGYDIVRDSMEVRKRIGYLPERSPLYSDMKVRDYLHFVGRLKGLAPPRLKSAVDNAVSGCGLESVFHSTIAKLSKGYQQRVGIAQAILHDPELLILDEPTIGLDPRQIIDIRQLIRNLGRDRTVILSSHILPEVNQVCDRVIIINKGKLVAVDSPDNLRERLRKSSVTRLSIGNSVPSGDITIALESIEGILLVSKEYDDGSISKYIIESEIDSDIRNAIIRKLVSEDIPLLEIYNEELSLEDIFIQLVTEEAPS